MRIAWDILVTLPVVTESGQTLGRIVSCVLEIEGHSICSYEVKPSILARHRYLIARDQVVAILEDKVIVKDAIYKTEEKKAEPSVPMRPAGALGRMEEGV
jgi:uncharacterized protein YrrD